MCCSREWIAADIKLRGKPYRFITTHLESLSSAIRSAQAAELLSGPANTDKAVVLAGDLNSDADSADPMQNEAYAALVGAGFFDAWISAHPNDPGFTWPLHGEDPFTPVATPSIRIDLVLSRGPVDSSTATLIGNTLGDLTPSGLWPSDHAGLVASFVLEP
jgi:endonuclease/exonuclease/phosphatase family metal-dependent hydrolase